MAITIAPQFTIKNYTWTNWKAAQVIKSGNHQYDDDGSMYTIYFYDGPEAHTCVIWKGTVPDGIITGGYSQAQNNSDKSDFEANFKPYANKPIGSKRSVSLGYTTSSGSALTVIRATAYTEQFTNAQRSLVSSDATDTSAGVGARTVTITYYDQTMQGPYTEIVTLNGVTPVNTVATNICFIEKFEVTTVGSALSNVGTLTLKAATAGGGVTIGTIPPGDGITNWCHHYVGANRTMNIVAVIGTTKGQNSGALEVHRTVPTSSTTPELTVSPKFRILPNSTDRLLFDVPIVVKGPAQVIVYGRSDGSSGTLDWSVGMGYYEE